MGKTKTKTRSGSGKDLLHSTSAHVKTTPSKSKSRSSAMESKSTEDLLTEATAFFEQSQPELALPLAEEALRRLEAEREHYANVDTMLQRMAQGYRTFPEALVLSAEIFLSMGAADEARALFTRAVEIDQDGAVISAEPWLELAQLCEEGGKQSIMCFEKACEVLRNEAEVLEEGVSHLDSADLERVEVSILVEEKNSGLAEALCAMAEVYMTDLSWELDAEQKCEAYVTEAVAVCPERLSAGVLQTLANVRISQERIEEAKQALARSMAIWRHEPEEKEREEYSESVKPPFATRVSLARLLMEVEEESEAMFVIEGLVKEDDQSVESLYLGGWCQVMLSQKMGISDEDKLKHEEQARLWLGNCLKLYKAQAYEDDRLQEHALELVSGLNKILGIADDDDEWEDDDDDVDDGDDDDLEVGVNGQEPHHDEDVEMT